MSGAGLPPMDFSPQPGSSPEDRSALDWARHAGEAGKVIREVKDRLRRRRRQRLVRAASAAALLLVLAGIIWRPPPATTPPPSGGVPAAATANIAVLRPETRTLPDGSVVETKPGGEIDVDFSGP